MGGDPSGRGRGEGLAAVGHDRAYGWQMTMTIWAVLCLVLFMVTFFSTKER